MNQSLVTDVWALRAKCGSLLCSAAWLFGVEGARRALGSTSDREFRCVGYGIDRRARRRDRPRHCAINHWHLYLCGAIERGFAQQRHAFDLYAKLSVRVRHQRIAQASERIVEVGIMRAWIETVARAPERPSTKKLPKGLAASISTPPFAAAIEIEHGDVRRWIRRQTDESRFKLLLKDHRRLPRKNGPIFKV